MTAIFISYAVAGASEKARIVDGLTCLGYPSDSLFIDSVRLRAGENWLPQLAHALRVCEVVVAAVTREWSSSHMCFFEAAYALTLGKPVVLVRFADASIDDALSGLHRIEAAERLDDERLRAKLGEALRFLPSTLTRTLPAGRSPFPGNRPYEEDDAAAFFGREAELADALRHLEELSRPSTANRRVLLIVGNSGVGKSSFLRAGIIAHIRADEPTRTVHSIDLADDARPVSPSMPKRPRNPKRRTPSPIFAVDHLEMALPLGEPGRDIAAVLAGLKHRAPADLDRWIVIGCLQAEGRHDLVLTGGELRVVSLEPMQRERASRAIIESLRHVREQAEIDPLVLSRTLDQHVTSDGATMVLPRLATALHQLWEHRDASGHIGHRAETAAQGPSAFARQAIDRWHALTFALGAAEEIWPIVLPRLIWLTRDGQLEARPARRGEFTTRERESLQQMLRARLLVAPDAERIELSDSGIIASWPGLAAALERERDMLELLAEVRWEAERWHERGGGALGPSAVALPTRLDALGLRQSSRFSPCLNSTIRAWLDACANRASRERQRDRLHELGTSVQDALWGLLGTVDRLRQAPGASHADIETLLRAALALAEQSLGEASGSEGAALSAELYLRLAEIFHNEGDPRKQIEAADRALSFTAVLPDAAAHGRLIVEALGHRAEAMRKWADDDGLRRLLGEARSTALQLRISGEDHARLCIAQANMLRASGDLSEAQARAAEALDHLDRCRAATTELLVLRAGAQRQLGAALSMRESLGDQRAGSEHTAEALKILLELERLGTLLGKDGRILKATLIQNRAAGRTPDQKEAVLRDYELAMEEAKLLLKFDPFDPVTIDLLAEIELNLADFLLRVGDKATALARAQDAFNRSLSLTRTASENEARTEQLRQAFVQLHDAAVASDAGPVLLPHLRQLLRHVADRLEDRESRLTASLYGLGLVTATIAHEQGHRAEAEAVLRQLLSPDTGKIRSSGLAEYEDSARVMLVRVEHG